MSITLLAMLLLCACSQGKQRSANHIDILRYDKTQYEYIEFHSFDAAQKMKSEYYPMTKLLVEDILRIGSIADDDVLAKLRDYYADSLLVRLVEDAQNKFTDITAIENDVGQAFASLAKHLPAVRIPRVYTQLTALNESIIVADTLLGISLDKYMGADYPLYPMFYYAYQRKTMTPERIGNDCVMSLLGSSYPFDKRQMPNLCNLMLHFGRIAYATAQITGAGLQEHLGYSDEEWKWCIENEKNIFIYMLEHGHFRSVDYMVLRKYMEPAPYVQFFGKQSPAMLGHWVGARIIEAYVEASGASLEDLMNVNNYNTLFANSRYLNMFV